MSQIHVCLVSEQPIPNLIPIKLLEQKPKKVIFLVSNDMKVQYERLKDVMNEWGVEKQYYPIEPYDFEKANITCREILKNLDKEQVVLNVTGGTKIMAISFFNAFKDNNIPIIYVDTQNKKIYKLNVDSNIEKIEFKGVIDVKTYLYVYGQQIINKSDKNIINNAHQNVINVLIQNINKFQNAIKSINVYASKARDHRKFPARIEINERDFINTETRELVKLYEKNGLLKLTKKEIIFNSKQNAEFASGGWLEEHVYSVVKELQPTDILMDVDTQWDQKGEKPTTNQYDVIFTYHNQLFIIECKTKRFEGKDIKESASDPVYKLDSLRDAAGGLYGKGMIVSYRYLTDEQKNRMKACKLEYCDGKDLINLKDKLKRWIQS